MANGSARTGTGNQQKVSISVFLLLFLLSLVALATWMPCVISAPVPALVNDIQH